MRNVCNRTWRSALELTSRASRATNSVGMHRIRLAMVCGVSRVGVSAVNLSSGILDGGACEGATEQQLSLQSCSTAGAVLNEEPTVSPLQHCIVVR